MKADSFRLSVKVVPSSSMDVIVGWLGESLKVKVRAPAEKNRANRAVEKLIANELGLSPGSVLVVSGHTAAQKTIEVSNISQSDGLKLLPAR